MNPKYEPGEEDGYVEVVATMFGVKVRICGLDDSNTVACITLAPEYARMLAQRITLGSIKSEEMRK